VFRGQDGHFRLVIAIAVVAVAVRFVAIGQPFIDRWSWRQSDVAAIARNYLRNGFHFAYPQIDWAGNQAGYVGTEFPILPFLAAASYRVTGVHEWIGRVQSVFSFAVSLPFFFLLVRRAFGTRAATWATFFYSFAPLCLMTSRCFMPDMPSLSLTIVGLYCFWRWLDKEHWAPFLVSALALSLAFLIKLPSAIVGVPLACLAFERFGKSAIHRNSLWIFAAIVLLPSALWYGHAYAVSQQFYPHHFFGAGGVRLMTAQWYWEIVERTLTLSLTPILVVLAVAGLVVGKKTKGAPLFYWWLAAMLVFIVVVGYGNRHPWYQLTLVPIAAAFAGTAIQFLLSRRERHPWLRISLIALLVAVFAFQSYKATKKFYEPTASGLRDLGLVLKDRTPKNSLIIVPDYGDPTVFYYAERKGWHFLEKDATYNGHPETAADAIGDLEKLRGQGATHIAFYSMTVWWLECYPELKRHLDATAKLDESTPNDKIFELKPAITE
jgi:4-amino-4-deoxy-L-arabinose transferase-like glycosyltransferase